MACKSRPINRIHHKRILAVGFGLILMGEVTVHTFDTLSDVSNVHRAEMFITVTGIAKLLFFQPEILRVDLMATGTVNIRLPMRACGPLSMCFHVTGLT
jgi:hypothetical protein